MINSNFGKETAMYLLCFHVPTTHLEIVKKAIFTAGAGKDKNYKDCCWQAIGTGEFVPLPGSNPFIGEIDKLEQVPEHQVSTYCDPADMKNIIAALKQSHPYEVPSYMVIMLEDF
jgi:structural hemagglutinin/hemolysin toxin protein RtxA